MQLWLAQDTDAMPGSFVRVLVMLVAGPRGDRLAQLARKTIAIVTKGPVLLTRAPVSVCIRWVDSSTIRLSTVAVQSMALVPQGMATLLDRRQHGAITECPVLLLLLRLYHRWDRALLP